MTKVDGRKISGLGLTQNDDWHLWLVSEAQGAFPVIGKLLRTESAHQILSLIKGWRNKERFTLEEGGPHTR